jgi:hypothetical protein
LGDEWVSPDHQESKQISNQKIFLFLSVAWHVDTAGVEKTLTVVFIIDAFNAAGL